MNAQSDDRRWPIAWQVGLQYLVIFYVGSTLASVFVQYVKSSVAAVDVQVADINRQSDAAIKNRDVEHLRIATEQLEAQYREMQTLRIVTFCGAVIAILGYGLLIVGTWKITQQPFTPLETVARYVAVGSILLIPLLCAGIQTEGMVFLAAVAAIVIFLGHLVAGFKIARKTGSPGISKRIRQNLHAIIVLLVLLLLLKQAARWLLISESVANSLVSFVKFALSVTVLIQAGSLWQLSRRLNAAPIAFVKE
ncbi:MAG: hypothetical protein JWP89_3643 [Schlesneria sp.]|nr:hypothetical protein [Schlesneria sp.]